jgi:hypothetical protein
MVMIKRHVFFMLGMAFTFGLVACVSPQPPRSLVRVPDNLKPGGNESLARIVSAKGVQIYECRARKDQVGEYEWAFVAPEADWTCPGFVDTWVKLPLLPVRTVARTLGD